MSKVPPNAYAKAFLETVKGKSEKDASRLIQNFIALIRRNGDWGKRKPIAEACAHLWRKANGRSLISIESARPLETAHRDMVEKTCGTKNTDYEEKVLPELIAGVRLTKDNEEQFDLSLRHVLRALFPKT